MTCPEVETLLRADRDAGVAEHLTACARCSELSALFSLRDASASAGEAADCGELEVDVACFLDGVADDGARERVARHLRACRDCLEFVVAEMASRTGPGGQVDEAAASTNRRGPFPATTAAPIDHDEPKGEVVRLRRLTKVALLVAMAAGVAFWIGSEAPRSNDVSVAAGSSSLLPIEPVASAVSAPEARPAASVVAETNATDEAAPDAASPKIPEAVAMARPVPPKPPSKAAGPKKATANPSLRNAWVEPTPSTTAAERDDEARAEKIARLEAQRRAEMESEMARREAERRAAEMARREAEMARLEAARRRALAAPNATSAPPQGRALIETLK
jgi:hypothetical protein